MNDTQTQQAEKKTGGRVLKGVVVKTAMKDTATVSISRLVKHQKYKKYTEVTKKYLVHDVGNKVCVGDIVLIKEVSPISKNKHFEIKEVVRVAARDE